MKKRIGLKQHFSKNQNKWIFGTIFIFSILIIFGLLYHSIFGAFYNFEIGEEVNENIYLTETVVDYIGTNEIKKQTINNIEPEWYIDFSVQVETKKTLNDFFTRMLEIKETYKNDTELLKRVYSGIERNNSYGFTSEDLEELIMLSTEKIGVLKNYAIDITSENLTNGIKEDEITPVHEVVEQYVNSLSGLRDIEKKFLIQFTENSIVANMFIDEEKTQIKKNRIDEQVDDIIYEEGTLLVKKGDILTLSNYEMMKQSGMLVQSSPEKARIIIGLIALVSLLFGMMHFYLFQFERDIVSSTKKYGALMSTFIIVFTSAAIMGPISPYLIPIPLFAMLIGVLLSNQIVLPTGIPLIIFISIWQDFSLDIFVMYLIALFMGSLLSKRIKQRSQILMQGLTISLVMVLFTFASTIVFKNFERSMGLDLLFIVANGFISSIVTLGIMPFFESAFQILTPFKLLELSNPNKPLLKRLMLEAPGTYHHSIMVGNLAETAAHDIGANGLLTRVGAFYHDIGKLERPYYFNENQITLGNPHDKLPAQVSANIIKSHVSDGLELAIQNKLPTEVQRLLAEHHGTTVIRYFYHKETLTHPDVSVEDFKYKGPKPSSKESVILMLADSVEAAVRSLESPTQKEIVDLVDKIIIQKIDEKQFIEANITLVELEIIKGSFVDALGGIFHERIKYPEAN